MRSTVPSFRVFFFVLFILFVAMESQALNKITGSTTLGTTIVPLPAKKLLLSKLIGHNELKLSFVTINGKDNTISFDPGHLEFAVDPSSLDGSIDVQIKIVNVGIARHENKTYQYVKLGMGDFSLELQLEFDGSSMAAITSASPQAYLPPTPVKLVVTHSPSNKYKSFSGVGGSSLDNLFQAVGLDNAYGVKVNLRAGVSPNAEISWEIEGCDTALTFAARSQAIEAATELLNAGADVNLSGCRGMTPLHCAAQESSLEMVRLLLAKGADPNARNEFNETPLDLAQAMQNTAITALLQSGTAINPAGLFQRTRTDAQVVDANLSIEPDGSDWKFNIETEFEDRGCYAEGFAPLRGGALLHINQDCQQEGLCDGPCIISISFDGSSGPLGPAAMVTTDFALGCIMWHCGANGGVALHGEYDKVR